MRLTWRDGVETALAALMVVAVVGFVQERSWPLLGTDRAGVGTVFALGFFMCQLGIRRSRMTGAGDLVRGPFMTAATLIGVVAFAMALVGLFHATRVVVVGVALATLASWVVATIHHAVENPLPVRR